MIRYPNQSLVTIQNESFEAENSKSNPYGLLRVFSSRKAATELSGTAYKIFVDLALNKDGYKMVLSPEAYYQELGISKGAYKSARKELIELGYLYPEPSKEDKNAYIFTPNPPRAQARTKKSKNENGLDISSKSTKNVPLEQADEKQQSSVENDIGQNLSPKGSENSPLKGQKMNHEGTGNEQETIQDSIYNTDNAYVGVDVPSLDKDISNENNDSVGSSINLAFDDKSKVWREEWKFKQIYRDKVNEANKNISIRAILDTYLSTHKETETQKILRSKYGVWIRGWDDEAHQPIIYYPTSWLFDYDMKHQNIADIPSEYYHEKLFELRNKKKPRYKGKVSDTWSIQYNRYNPVDKVVSSNTADVTGANDVSILDEDISSSNGADELVLDDTDDDEDINYEDLVAAIKQDGYSYKYSMSGNDDLLF